MLKAVIFDLDDTLYDYATIHQIAMEKLRAFTCEKYSIGEDDFDKAFSKAKKQTKKLLKDTASCHNRLLYCQKTLENLGQNPVCSALEMYDCYWNCMLENMKLRQGSIELLERLKSDGIKIAICTDMTAHIQYRKILKLGLVPYIDVLVTSEEAGEEKPSQKMYGLAFEKLLHLVPNLKLSECLFTGDSHEKDVEAPLSFGMKSVLFMNMKDLEEKIYG